MRWIERILLDTRFVHSTGWDLAARRITFKTLSARYKVLTGIGWSVPGARTR